MTLEKVVVDSYLLDPDDPFARYEFDDTIYEQEGITMRQQLLDCQRIEDCFHGSNKNAAGEPSGRIAAVGMQLHRRDHGPGAADAVAGFLLLNSVMKARVMSMLSAA